MCNPGYGFLRDDIPGGTSSFTQMIWKPTKRFGIGKATSREDGMFCTYIVALYDEKGNNRDEYANNVLKGAFDLNYCDSLGKEHRHTFRRYQRGRVEDRSQINTITESSKRNDSIEIDKKDIDVSPSVRIADKTLNGVEKTLESVLRPEDIVLSIKKIDPEPISLKNELITNKQTSNETRSEKDGKSFTGKSNSTSPSTDNSHAKNKSINSTHTKNKKIIVDNLMQLNDFVMKVSERNKMKKSKKSR